VAILPQLIVLQRYSVVENLTGHYVFFLGAYRGLYILNWVRLRAALPCSPPPPPRPNATYNSKIPALHDDPFSSSSSSSSSFSCRQIYRSYTEKHYHHDFVVYGCGLVQTALYVDFFYYYAIR
jgi:ER lumen protein retaining receptor